MLTEMLLCAASRSMPVVSAIICAISGMQAVLPSSLGNSSGENSPMGSSSLTEEAGASGEVEALLAGVSAPLQAVRMPAAEQAARPSRKLRREILAFFIRRSSYNKIVVFIDRSPAECYNSFRVLWIGEALLPQRRFLGGSNHSFFVEMLIS